MPVDGWTGDTAFAFFAWLNLLFVRQSNFTKLRNRPVLILGRLAVLAQPRSQVDRDGDPRDPHQAMKPAAVDRSSKGGCDPRRRRPRHAALQSGGRFERAQASFRGSRSLGPRRRSWQSVRPPRPRSFVE